MVEFELEFEVSASSNIGQTFCAAGQAGHVERLAALHGAESRVGPAWRLPQGCIAGPIRGWCLHQQSILGKGVFGGCLAFTPLQAYVRASNLLCI